MQISLEPIAVFNNHKSNISILQPTFLHSVSFIDFSSSDPILKYTFGMSLMDENKFSQALFWRLKLCGLFNRRQIIIL